MDEYALACDSRLGRDYNVDARHLGLLGKLGQQRDGNIGLQVARPGVHNIDSIALQEVVHAIRSSRDVDADRDGVALRKRRQGFHRQRRHRPNLCNQPVECGVETRILGLRTRGRVLRHDRLRDRHGDPDQQD